MVYQGWMLKGHGLNPRAYLFLIFLDKAQAYTGRTYFLNIFYALNITKLGYTNHALCHKCEHEYVTNPSLGLCM